MELFWLPFYVITYYTTDETFYFHAHTRYKQYSIEYRVYSIDYERCVVYKRNIFIFFFFHIIFLYIFLRYDKSYTNTLNTSLPSCD